jgi:cytochrome c
MVRLMVIAGALLMLALTPAARAQDTGLDIGLGEELSHRCTVCHEVGPDARNRVGPVLNNLFGRRAGTLPGFTYTPEMIAAGEGGLVWTPETLTEYLTSPRGMIHGVAMGFRGFDRPQDIADVVAYLETFTTPEGAEITEGAILVSTYCGSCHAIGPEGASQHLEAPPFRDLHERYDVEFLSEALVEGLVSGHPDMPEFEFDPQQAAAIVAYLKSLETE